jgi:hypothetical protein
LSFCGAAGFCEGAIGGDKAIDHWHDELAGIGCGLVVLLATPGRSIFVRLKESTKGSAGKWTDAATIGVMLFPGTGIQENLADKAKKLGIPVWKFGGA